MNGGNSMNIRKNIDYSDMYETKNKNVYFLSK